MVTYLPWSKVKGQTETGENNAEDEFLERVTVGNGDSFGFRVKCII